MSIHSPEVQQRIAALMAVARDGRRTRQVREAALRELKELTAQKQQRQQGQQAWRTVTAVSPSVPAQPHVSRSVPPVSILNDPKPNDDAEDPGDPENTDTARLRHIQDDRARLLEYLERARSIGDEERIQYAEERLAELDQPATPARETPEAKPAEKSDWQKLHEYFYGEPSQAVTAEVKVDFAGASIPGKPFWDREEREARGRALSAKRTAPARPRVTLWGDDSDLPWSNEF